MNIEVVYGNIIKQPDAQAIVNSANVNLRLGSGVAGAIHTAAGPELETYCRPYAPLAKGRAILTPGFKLSNPWIIHACSSHYFNDENAAEIMRQAIEAAVDLTAEHGIRSIALPAIGIGVFKFPIELAAQITGEALLSARERAPQLEWARICVADLALVSVYQNHIR